VAKAANRNPGKARAARKLRPRGAPRKWSAAVTRNSNALDLERKVFAKAKPEAIARSLKRSAERSRRRKVAPYRSAMAMLTFYINRAGKNLPKSRRNLLERSKVALRKAFGRP
jgi:Protein of unknown function (DUF3175)